MMPFNLYFDRMEAGQALAKELIRYGNQNDTLVLALPRGGVPAGLEVARLLRAPLDVFLARKLSVPDYPDIALGAVSSGDVLVLNDNLVQQLSVSPFELAAVADRANAELRRQIDLYQHGNEPPEIAGANVLLVDDGLATGASMRATLAALRTLEPARIMIGVPVGAPDTCEKMAAEVDDLVCPLRPNPFHAVGIWYTHFPEITDKEVCRCLESARNTLQRENSQFGHWPRIN
jgi:putative phosphoribosyl transferase